MTDDPLTLPVVTVIGSRRDRCGSDPLATNVGDAALGVSFTYPLEHEGAGLSRNDGSLQEYVRGGTRNGARTVIACLHDGNAWRHRKVLMLHDPEP